MIVSVALFVVSYRAQHDPNPLLCIVTFVLGAICYMAGVELGARRKDRKRK
jgi:hypothetical protein